jgi:hypothetical protein
MMSKTTAAYMVRAYIVLVCIGAAYQAYAYTGIYRWLAEWQLAQFQSYNLRLTIAGSILLPALPVCAVAEIFGIPYRTGRRGAPAANASGFVGLLVVFGVIAVLAAAGSFALGYEQSQQPVAIETVDLGDQKQPQSDHVRMTAIARTDMMVKLELRSGGTRFYTPLTAPKWKRSDPITYILRSNVDAVFTPDGRMLSLDPQTPPFRVTQVGVLVRDDLPGPVAESYRKRNLTFASPVMVLELSSDAELDRYWIVAGVSGLVGFVFLLVAGVARMQQARAGGSSASATGKKRRIRAS